MLIPALAPYCIMGCPSVEVGRTCKVVNPCSLRHRFAMRVDLKIKEELGLAVDILKG